MKVFGLNPRVVAFEVALLIFAFCGSSALGQTVPCAQGQQTFNYTNFSSLSGLQLNGSAAAANNGSANVLRLTPAQFIQAGSAYCATTLSLSSGFTITFTFQITIVSPDGVGPADGIALVIQNSPSMNTALGYFGGATGYGDDDFNFFPTKGIPNSLALEIDTYRNPWDPATPHMAAMSCLTGNNTAHHGPNCQNGPRKGLDPTIAINSSLPVNVLDGKQHTVAFRYDTPAVGQNVSVTLDGAQVLKFGFDVATLGLDANDDAYVGFTSGTGGGFELHDILSFNLSRTLVEPVSNTTPTTFAFSTATNNILTHVVDFSQVGISGLTYPLNDPATLQLQSTEIVVDAATWPQYVTGGPLATSQLFALTSASGSGPSGALFEDACFDPTLNPPALPLEANCPTVADSSNAFLGILITADLLPPKPPVNNPVNTGMTTAMADYHPNTIPNITTWSPSPINGHPNPACTNTLGTAGNNGPQACDVLDIQQTLYGDQTTSSGRKKTHSTFAMIFNVPMALSTVSMNGGTPVNTPPINNNPSAGFFSLANSSLQLSFLVNPACPTNTFPCVDNHGPIYSLLSGVNQGETAYNYFVPAPLASETFQVSTDPQGANVVFPSSNPPAQADPPVGFNTQTLQPITFTGTIPSGALQDGQYFLQWSAMDDVGILEQNIQLFQTGTCPNPVAPASPITAPCYQTTLFDVPFMIDSTPPMIGTITITPSDPPVYKQPATAIFACSDPTAQNGAPASGIKSCVGPNSQTSPDITVDTTSVGPHKYAVTATDNAGNTATLSQDYTVGQAPATLTLSGLSATYDGTAKSASATTNPLNLNVSFTYNGSATAPTSAGSYAVVATISDPNYTGTASGTLIISQAAASVTLTNLSQTFTGGPLSPTVTTVPASLGFTLTGAPDTNAGSYPVTATVTAPNYTGTASGTFVITRPMASGLPASWNFGSVRAGTTASKTFTLTNTGNAPMTINSIKLTLASDSDEFSVSSTCKATLAAGANCTITVYYHADRDDSNGASAKLVVSDNAPGSPQSVALSGKKL